MTIFTILNACYVPVQFIIIIIICHVKYIWFFIRQIVEQAPYYCLLYKIRPGMTSWGPIRVGYTDTLQKMIDRLNYDIVYMENMSLRLDIKILFYTIGVILDGKGK